MTRVKQPCITTECRWTIFLTDKLTIVVLEIGRYQSNQHDFWEPVRYLHKVVIVFPRA